MKKVNLFISYSHQDQEPLEELSKYLNDTTCPQINIWTDGKIDLGQEWDNEIKDKLNSAEIVLLLVSQDFLMSDFIKKNELSVALQRHQQGKTTVIPIFLRTCTLTVYPQITELQGYPAANKPLLEAGDKKDIYYTKLQEKINDIANKIITNSNISDSRSNDNGDVLKKAEEIDLLRNTNKIFLAIPGSEEGLELRKNFIINVDGKIKYEKPKWPYEIIPSIPDAEDISKLNPADQESKFETLLSQSIYVIHIVASPEDLKNKLFLLQYELANKSTVQPAIIHNILWFSNVSIKSELESLEEAFRNELKQVPTVIGPDFKAIFRMIEEFDIAKEKKINQLLTRFSPVKKVFMFYDFEKDNDSDLRIQLRKKIQEDNKFAIRDLADESFENQTKGIEECNGAIIFYGSNSDSAWYKVRERIVLKASNIKFGAGAVCVDGNADPDIDRKVDRDVSITEILPIKGKKELETKLIEFKKSLTEA